MAKIVWTEPALNNLDDIAEYIALSHLPAASKLVQTIFTTVDRLQQHPNSGKVPQELPELGIREVVVNPCRVFYKQKGETIYILHIMRQEQQLKKYLLDYL